MSFNTPMITANNNAIKNVSDTALWVAYYRALESKRTDALFHDDLAQVLIGDRGQKIAESMPTTARYTQWSVVMRTFVIDEMILDLIKNGVDTVINLGAGLDTRPYRLSLPKSVRWIEVDYSHLISYKEQKLSQQTPQVHLERISIDLADRQKRKDFFKQIAQESKNILVLTEGVILYLNEEQVSELAQDLRAEPHFRYWIAEYVSPYIYRYFKTKERIARMKNAPFLFFPEDWFGFFKKNHWLPEKTVYLSEVAAKLGRNLPLPWWAAILKFFVNKKNAKKFQQQMGYVVFTPERS